MQHPYFISFIEECILNPEYDGYIGGRVEVYIESRGFALEEIRFFTKDRKGFNHLRELWDLKDIEEDELEELRGIIAEKYQENI